MPIRMRITALGRREVNIPQANVVSHARIRVERPAPEGFTGRLTAYNNVGSPARLGSLVFDLRAGESPSYNAHLHGAGIRQMNSHVSVLVLQNWCFSFGGTKITSPALNGRSPVSLRAVPLPFQTRISCS